MASEQFERAVALIDAANGASPHRELENGEERAKELLYGRRMTEWVKRLQPAPSEALLLAARSQHIRRWEISRNAYPPGRAGYHQWRTTLYRYHAEQAAALLREAGYDEDKIARVASLLQKKHLKSDPDAQTLEDAAALVFLEHDLESFAAREDMDEEKLIGILRKTWRKMSARGRDAALALPTPRPRTGSIAARAPKQYQRDETVAPFFQRE